MRLSSMGYDRGAIPQGERDDGNEEFREKLRDLAEAKLRLYIREMGDEFFAKLLAYKANWRAGYVPAHVCYWCTPRTADGNYIVGPFTAIKWTKQELEALGVFPSMMVVTEKLRPTISIGHKVYRLSPEQAKAYLK